MKVFGGNKLIELCLFYFNEIADELKYLNCCNHGNIFSHMCMCDCISCFNYFSVSAEKETQQKPSSGGNSLDVDERMIQGVALHGATSLNETSLLPTSLPITSFQYGQKPQVNLNKMQSSQSVSSSRAKLLVPVFQQGRPGDSIPCNHPGLIRKRYFAHENDDEITNQLKFTKINQPVAQKGQIKIPIEGRGTQQIKSKTFQSSSQVLPSSSQESKRKVPVKTMKPLFKNSVKRSNQITAKSDSTKVQKIEESFKNMIGGKLSPDGASGVLSNQKPANQQKPTNQKPAIQALQNCPLCQVPFQSR